MQLDKENIKKIVGIVSFAILLNWGLKNTEFIGKLMGLAIGLVLPFLIGGSLASIINVPMRFLERKLFDEPYAKRKKMPQQKKNIPEKPPIWWRMKRPLSLILSLILVVGVIFLGMFLIVPEIADSFSTIAVSIKQFPDQLHRWSLQLMDRCV